MKRASIRAKKKKIINTRVCRNGETVNKKRKQKKQKKTKK